MELYVLRHAIAVEHGAPGYETDDDARPLTDAGRDKLKKVVRGMATLGVDPETVISSPYPRARQTADGVVAGLRLKRGIVLTHLLTPGAPHGALLEYLATGYGENDRIMIVGHEPHLSGFMAFVLTGQERLRIELKKAGMGVLDVQHPGTQRQSATLRWLMTPRQLAAVR